MNREAVRKISFLVDKDELNLLEETCLYGADADKNIEEAKSKNSVYRIEFLYEELDDLAGYAAHCANHEKSGRKQERWDDLCEKIERLLKLSDAMNRHNKKGFPKPMPKRRSPQTIYYTFDIWIEKKGGMPFNRKVVRKIRIPSSKSLYNFARVITRAFGFYFDHCFGYYNNFERHKDSNKIYELFVDIGERPESARAKSVKNTKIYQAFKETGDKMLFCFDYGDNWYFGVELKEMAHIDKWNLDPIVLKRTGKAPLQYPPCRD